MKLESFSIRGILRFAETLALDLRDLPPGLIAFVGPNGSGKTTALETPLAAIHRRFPSRDKELADYAHDRDSHVDVVFALDDGCSYRARVNVDGVRRVSEAVLEQLHPDGTRTVLNDGKVSTFDEAVARVFPAREVLLASAFAAQNHNGSFITLDRKGRKDLFAKLLGLDHYEQMAQTARTAAGLVELSRLRLVATGDVLARDAGPDVARALDERGQAIGIARSHDEAERTALQVEITDAEARLATVADQVAAFAVASQRVQTAERELSARQAERVRLQQDRTMADQAAENDRGRIRRALAVAMNGLDARKAKALSTKDDERALIDRTWAATLKDLDERITNNRAVLAQADAIRAAAAAVADIDAKTQTAQADRQRWQSELSALMTAEREVAAKRLEATKASTLLVNAKADAALIGKVPCEASGAFAACQFLVKATAAAARIPSLEGADSDLRALTEQITTIEASRTQAEGQISVIGQTLLALEQDKKRHQATAKLESAIATAEERIADLETQRLAGESSVSDARAAADSRATARLAEISAERLAAQDRSVEDLADVSVRLEARRTELDSAIASIDGLLVQLAEQLQAARRDLSETEAGNQQAAQLQAALTVLRARWDASTRQLAQLDAATQDVERQRRDLEDRRAELADVAGRIATLDTELLEWQLLGKALGRDGLPVLEIDAAGPTVSTFANDLLASCFGPRFSIELVTQEAKASGKGMKESFAIQVYDNERGGSARDIGDLSGGEQIIVEEALKNAIALFVNRRNTSPIRTCWRDETTGPLDPENAARYVPMLRKVLELGGFERIYFISHNPEAAAMADAQVRFADGTATVALPPYAA